MNVLALAPATGLAQWQDQALDLALHRAPITVQALGAAAPSPRPPLTVATLYHTLDRRLHSHPYWETVPPSRSRLDWRRTADHRELSINSSTVILDMTGRPHHTLNTLSQVPPHGVWFYGLSGSPLRFDTTLGLRELSGRAHVGAVDLYSLRQDRTVSLCGRAEIRTHPTSPVITEERLLQAAIPLLDHALARLLRHAGRADVFAPFRNDHATSGGWVTDTASMARSVARTAVNQLTRRRHGEWTVGIITGHRGMLTHGALERVSWYPPSPDRYLADPFVIDDGDHRYVFVEEYSHTRHRGHISVLDLSPAGTLSPPRAVLQTSHHLSFPSVFRHEDTFYMVPEQAARNQVVLYRATAFPDTWTEERVLLEDFPGVDPSLYHDGARWWLFVTYGAHGHQDSNLHLFWSETLDGTFVPHVNNPIAHHIAGSRMAGRLFVHDGELYRPSQNCSARYGGSLRFYAVDELTPTRYHERLVTEITALDGPFKHGLHTFNAASDVLVVDGLRFVHHAH